MNISSIRPIINYGKRILKVYPDAAIGFNTDIIGKAMRETKGDVWTRAKAGFHAIENDVAVKSSAEGNFFKRIYKNIVGMPSTIKTSAKVEFGVVLKVQLKVLVKQCHSYLQGLLFWVLFQMQ